MRTNFKLVPLVDTPLKVTITCFTPAGIPVKVTDVPEVVAAGVPRVNPADIVAKLNAPDPLV
jgi:hypothetical protein